jgi:hypothetical protein
MWDGRLIVGGVISVELEVISLYCGPAFEFRWFADCAELLRCLRVFMEASKNSGVNELCDF